MAARVKKDDIVVVIAGDHKGARGKVLRVLTDDQRVLIEGVNMVFRHVRRSRKNPQGGRVQREAPIHLSNVMPVDPKTGKGTRVRFRVEAGAKQRLALSGTVLSDVRKSPVSKSGAK